MSDYERHRNLAIHEAQGNRNPFIDLPSRIRQVALDEDVAHSIDPNLQRVGAMDEGDIRLQHIGAELPQSSMLRGTQQVPIAELAQGLRPSA